MRGQEAPVGKFSLDILAHDLGSNRTVIVESQLGTTDHDHLGKLLTYASGYDAGVVVWLAREFREEHRQALDWLNQRKGEDTHFFGVIIELLRIDNSRPAVNFKLAASPNEWRDRSRGISERMERYRSFFQVLIDRLREDEKFTTARKGQPQSWCNFASGRGSIAYSANFKRQGRAGVTLSMENADRDINKSVFDRLVTEKEAIESELNEDLEWNRLDNSKASRIDAVRPGSIDDDDETLEEIREWMVERLLAFKKVFGPRLIALDF